jgi:hypothetical protein
VGLGVGAGVRVATGGVAGRSGVERGPPAPPDAAGPQALSRASGATSPMSATVGRLRRRRATGLPVPVAVIPILGVIVAPAGQAPERSGRARACPGDGRRVICAPEM